MAGRKSSAVEWFAAQFRAEGDRIVYRRKASDPGIIISRDEYEKFIDDFERHFKLSNILMYVGAIPCIAIMATLAVKAEKAGNIFGVYLAVSIAFLYTSAFLAWTLWLLRAPARALGARTATAAPAEPLGKEEVERANLKRLSWANLGAQVLIVVSIFASVIFGDSFDGWHLLLLVAGAVILVRIGLIAWKKWRLERGRPNRIVS